MDYANGNRGYFLVDILNVFGESIHNLSKRSRIEEPEFRATYSLHKLLMDLAGGRE